MFKGIILTICTLSLLIIGGCGNDKYYDVMKEIVIAQQLQAAKDEAKRADEQRKHEEFMAKFGTELMKNASASGDKSFQATAPLMVMLLEDKWSTQRAQVAAPVRPNVSLSDIRPPETWGEFIQKSTGVILGGFGTWLGITQSNNLTKVAVSGINGAGVHNTASDGSVINTGHLQDSSVNGGSSTRPVTTTNTESSYNTSN